MTFNFVAMFFLLILLLADYISFRRSASGSGGFFHQTANSYDTGMRFALLLYLIYVFGKRRISPFLDPSFILEVPSNSRLGSPTLLLGTMTIGRCTPHLV